MGKEDKIVKLTEKRKSAKIAAMVTDKKPEIYQAAIAALGTVGDDDAMNTLVVLLRDQSADKRAAAVKSLGQMAAKDSYSSTAKTHLQYMKTHEKDEMVRQTLEETFSMISQAK